MPDDGTSKEKEMPMLKGAATDVFSDISKTSSLANGSDKIIDDIVHQTEKLEDALILGPQPGKRVFGVSGIQLPWTYKTAQLLFRLVIFAGIISSAYFYYSFTLEAPYLEEIFENNIARRIEQTSTDIMNLKTEQNAHTYLAVAIKLSKLIVSADKYIYNQSQYHAAAGDTNVILESPENNVLLTEISQLLSVIIESLSQSLAPSQFIPPGKSQLDVETDYKIALKQYFTDKKLRLQKQIGHQEEKDNIIKQLKELQTASALINNKEFFSVINDLDVNNITTEDIERLNVVVNTLTPNEFTIISKVQQSRVPWSLVIEKIEEITRELDPFFGHAVVSDLGSISYKSYNFDSSTENVTIVGDLKTEDLRNFTDLSRLVDKFEQSPYFKNVDVRNFNKDVTEDKTSQEVVATSPISIKMTLEDIYAKNQASLEQSIKEENEQESDDKVAEDSKEVPAFAEDTIPEKDTQESPVEEQAVLDSSLSKIAR